MINNESLTDQALFTHKLHESRFLETDRREIFFIDGSEHLKAPQDHFSGILR